MDRLRKEYLNVELEDVHLHPLSVKTEKITEAQKVSADEAAPVEKEQLKAETALEALDLSVRVFNSLKRTGITTVGDVLDLLEKGETAVMSIPNCGERSLDGLRGKMREKGYLKDEMSSAE